MPVESFCLEQFAKDGNISFNVNWTILIDFNTLAMLSKCMFSFMLWKFMAEKSSRIQIWSKENISFIPKNSQVEPRGELWPIVNDEDHLEIFMFKLHVVNY